MRDTDARDLIVAHEPVTMVERGVSRLASVDLGGAEGLVAAE